MSVPAKKNLHNTTSQLALNVMHKRRQLMQQKAEKSILRVFLPKDNIFPVSYHNRWFKRGEFDQLLDIAQDMINDGTTLNAIAQKLREGKDYPVYATTREIDKRRCHSRRKINTSPADLEQLEAEADMYIAQGERQQELLKSAFNTALEAQLETY